jgi:hypothetical protein
MIDYDRDDWVGTVFSFRGTALRHAAGRVLVVTLFAECPGRSKRAGAQAKSSPAA